MKNSQRKDVCHFNETLQKANTYYCSLGEALAF